MMNGICLYKTQKKWPRAVIPTTLVVHLHNPSRTFNSPERTPQPPTLPTLTTLPNLFTHISCICPCTSTDRIWKSHYGIDTFRRLGRLYFTCVCIRSLLTYSPLSMLVSFLIHSRQSLLFSLILSLYRYGYVSVTDATSGCNFCMESFHEEGVKFQNDFEGKESVKANGNC